MKEALRISNSKECARRSIEQKRTENEKRFCSAVSETEPQAKKSTQQGGYVERLYNEWVMLCAGLCICFFMLLLGGDALRDISESEGVSALSEFFSDAIEKNGAFAVFFGIEDELKDESFITDGAGTDTQPSPLPENEQAPTFVIGEGLCPSEYIEKYNKLYYKLSGEIPVVGVVTSEYSFRKNPFYGIHEGEGEYEFHSGIDIAAKEGSEIRAYLGGVVTKCALSASYGYYVKIDHGDGLVTLYAHAKKLLCSEGDIVEKGQVIALVGETGRATGPHLHFEVHEGEEKKDPAEYLSELF